MEGLMKKKGGAFGGSLQSRHFVLSGTTLTYYKKKGDKEPAGQIDLTGCTVKPEGRNGLSISGPSIKKKYELQCDSDDDLAKWITPLEAAAGKTPSPASVETEQKAKQVESETKPVEQTVTPSAAPAKQNVTKEERKEVKPGSQIWITKLTLDDGSLDFSVENASSDSSFVKVNLTATKHVRVVTHGDAKEEDGCVCIFLDPAESGHMLTMYKEKSTDGEAPSMRVGYMFTKDDPSEKFLNRQRGSAGNKISEHIAKILEVGGDENDLEKTTELCKKHGIKFVDLEMPPEKFNLPQFIWQRPCEFVDIERDGKPVLFDDLIEPNDIFQGSLGDCWYMCALATMAEFPAVIRKCLPERPGDDDTGVHRMRICKDGWWKVVTVDDYFPCNFGRGPAYAKNKGVEMWSAIMEKAYAKVHGSFDAMCTGLTGQALSELTGFPYKKFSVRTKDFNADQLWENMKLWDEADYMMSAGTPGDGAAEWGGDGELDGPSLLTEEDYYKAGFITAHSYSVIDCHETNGYRLLKIRNPWGGDMEWNGDWSDHSPLWTDDIRKELEFVAGNDGLFWMSYEDFLRYFVNVTVCFNHIHSEWRDVRAQGHFDGGRPEWVVELNVKTSTKAFISISQKDKRSKSKDDHDYDYYELGFVMLRPDDTYGYAVQEWTGFMKSRDVWVECALEANPKPYLIIPWTCHSDRRLYNLSVCTEQQNFGEIKFREFDDSLIESAVRIATFSKGKEKVWNEESKCSTYSFAQGRFLGVLAVNRGTKTWKIRFDASKCPNYCPLPGSELKAELVVPKGSMRYIGTFFAVTSSYTFDYSLAYKLADDGPDGNEGFEVKFELNTGTKPAIAQVDGDKKDHTELLTTESLSFI